jgi:hypothetical protein
MNDVIHEPEQVGAWLDVDGPDHLDMSTDIHLVTPYKNSRQNLHTRTRPVRLNLHSRILVIIITN